MSRDAKAAKRSARIQYVTFRLADETYAINVMQVREVLRVTEIAPVPGAPGYVLGIINLRGNVVTVIDARARMGLAPKDPDDLSRIVVIEGREHVVGMLVDSVAEVIELADSEIEPAPSVGSEEGARCIQGVACRENQLTIIIDLNKLVSSEGMSDFGFG